MTEPTSPEVQDLSTLVSQIVQLRELMKQVEADKQRAQEQLNACATQLLALKSQMTDARNLLDHCLDTGEDVTTVKLTKTVSELSLTKRILMEEDKMFDKVNKQFVDLMRKNIHRKF